MNKERILALASIIESKPHKSAYNYLGNVVGFNMNRFNFDCGTPACIAGWAISEFGEDHRIEDFDSRAQMAEKILDIGYKEGNRLFFCDGFHIDLQEIKPEHAAAVLRHFEKTGEVDWRVGAPEGFEVKEWGNE